MKLATFLALIGAASTIHIKEEKPTGSELAHTDTTTNFHQLFGGEAIDEMELAEMDDACDTSKMFVAVFSGDDCQKKNKLKDDTKEANKWIKRRSYEFDGECHAHNKKGESILYRCKETKIAMNHWPNTECKGKTDDFYSHTFGKCYNQDNGTSVRVWYKGRNVKKSNYRGRTD